MKKILMVGGITIAVFAVLALAASVFFVGRAYAQTQAPPVSGWGMGWHRGMMGGGRMGWDGSGSYGPMHEYMIATLAEALDLTPEALQERIDKGETPYQIAQSQGLSDEQIRDLFEQAHDAALQKAVEAGVITQEQADWMAQHHDQMWQAGTPGAGGCMSGGGRSPRGRWNSLPTSQP